MIRTFAIVALMAAATPALAAQAPATDTALSMSMSAPVALTGCNAQIGAPDVAFAQPMPSVYSVSFVNHGRATATNVAIDVTDGRVTRRFDDRGRFSTNVGIDNVTAFQNFDRASGKPSCSIARVDFADGTVWTPGVAAAALK